MTKERILVIDDEPKLRTLLRRSFESEGYDVSEACDLVSARAKLETCKPDLVTVDLKLGQENGFAVVRNIRETSQVPIILVTASDDVIDLVVGLELGADDYIRKPFHLREVLARVKSVMRRSEPALAPRPCGCRDDCNCGTGPAGDIISFDGLQVFPDRFLLLGRDGKPIDLTSGDFQLLQIFLDHPRRVLSRDMLMDMIGGTGWSPLDRTIDNRVARLRKKIERNHNRPRLIKTIRGVGYSFCDNGTRQAQEMANIA